MPQSQTILAIDVGGTTIKGAAVDRELSALATATIDTPAHQGDRAVLDAIVSLIDRLRVDPRPVHCSIVVPGVVDPATGTAVFSANIGWRNLPLASEIERATGFPTTLDHDVAAAGLAEARLGSLVGAQSALFVPIGTGIAASIIVDGRPFRGSTNTAGEIGHMVVVADGDPCGCGNHGCVEAYAAAAGIQRRYHQRSGRELSARDIIERRHQDPIADGVWRDAISALAAGLANATVLLDPDRIAIGGGIGETGEALLVPLRRQVEQRLPFRAPPAMSSSTMGPLAARTGAAILGWHAVTNRSDQHPPTEGI